MPLMPSDYRFKHSTVDIARKRSRWAWALYICLVVSILVGVVYLRHALLPFIIALLIAFVLEPPVRMLRRRGVPRWCGVVICYVVIIGGFVSMGMYLAPKLKQESLKVAKTLRGLLAEVPATFESIGRDVETILEKLEGRTPKLAPSGPMQDDEVAAQWGYGPTPIPYPVFESSDVVALPVIMLGADAENIVRLRSDGLSVTGRRSTDEVAADTSRSHIVLKRLDDGVYGIKFNQANFEVTEQGDGVVTIRTRPEIGAEIEGQSFRNRVIKGLRSSLERFAGTIVAEVVSLVGDIVAILARSLILLTVILMVTAFILVDTERITGWWRTRIPCRFRDDYDDLVSRLGAGLSGVVRGQLFICLFNGVLSGIGFFIFIPEYALVLAIFAGVMSLIPIFGTIISTLPAALIGLTVSWPTALAVVGWIGVVHAIEANILSPKIMSREAKIHPVVVIFSLIVGESLLGIMGALLAVPVVSVLQSVMGFVFEKVRPVVVDR
jgi:predicted PurR-regulated permease PerM